MIGPSLPSLAEQTNRGLEDMGTLLLLLPLGFLAGIYTFRYLSSYRVVHWLIVGMIFTYILTIISIAFIPAFHLLIAIFLVLAICQGFLDLLCNITLMRLYQQNSAPYMNAMHFIFGVGAMFSPAIIGLSVQYFNRILPPYILFALLGIPALIMLCFVRIQPYKSDETDSAQRTKRPNILPLIHIFFAFYLLMEVGYSSWIYPYMKQSGLLNAAAAGLFTSGFWLAFTLFRLIGTFLSLRFHPLKIMLGHAFICFAATLLMTFFSDNLVILWFGNISLGAGLSVFFACMLSYCGSYLHIPFKDISHFFTSATVGAMGGPWLLSQLFAIDPTWIFYPLIIAAAMSLLVLIYLKKANDKMERVSVPS